MLAQTYGQFIWRFIKKQKGLFILFQLLALEWSLDNLVWSYLLKLLVDTFVGFSGAPSSIWPFVLPILIAWGGALVIIDLMYWLQGYVGAVLFPRLESQVRMSMYRYVSGHSYNYFANNLTGNISNKINDMVSSSSMVLESVMCLIVPAFFALLISLGIFVTVKPVFAVLLLTWAVLHIGFSLLMAPRNIATSSERSDARSVLTGKIVDSLTNIISVKLFAKRGYEYDYIYATQKDEQQKHRRMRLFITKVNIGLSISGMIFPNLLMLWYVIYNWQHGIIGVGDAILIMTVTGKVQMLAWMVGHELPTLFRELGTCSQAMTIVSKEHDVVDAPGATDLTVTRGDIAFENVSFRYSEDNALFEKVSLDIAGGSKVGLVGYSGGGKSTFINLIIRFFDLESGKICIDGTNIQDVTRDSLRRQISMIPQEPSLFHRSLRDNIAYGKPDATDDDVINAAKHAHCHDFILKLPEGYDTLVGERGVKLSGGQRQRVAIARAILDDAPILILDEATSALDSATEKHIQEAMKHLMHGRTTLVIAHRLSTLQEMDRILVFNKGQIIEDGTHQQLLDKDKHYAKLWRMQAGGFIPNEGE